MAGSPKKRARREADRVVGAVADLDKDAELRVKLDHSVLPVEVGRTPMGVRVCIRRDHGADAYSLVLGGIGQLPWVSFAEVLDQARRKLASRRDGYVASGKLPGGGEYRWTVIFSDAARAQAFADAIQGPDYTYSGPAGTSVADREHVVRSVKREGAEVCFVAGPNNWPGHLFAADLARFGGRHAYLQVR